MMRFIIIFILLICNFAFTSAQTYTFDMYETSGGDYSVSIDLQRKQITASRAGRQIFNYNYLKLNIDNGTGVIGFSFDDRYSVIMRPDHDEHYFLVRKDAIFCSTSNASQEFYFKPKNTDRYIATYQSLLNGLTDSNASPTPQQSNPSQNLTFTVGGVSFTMVYVPSGTFTMGATSEQGSDFWDYEKPTHSVTLSGYHIGQTEVTQALWKAVMGSNPSYFKGDSRPRERISICPPRRNGNMLPVADRVVALNMLEATISTMWHGIMATVVMKPTMWPPSLRTVWGYTI